MDIQLNYLKYNYPTYLNPINNEIYYYLDKLFNFCKDYKSDSKRHANINWKLIYETLISRKFDYVSFEVTINIKLNKMYFYKNGQFSDIDGCRKSTSPKIVLEHILSNNEKSIKISRNTNIISIENDGDTSDDETDVEDTPIDKKKYKRIVKVNKSQFNLGEKVYAPYKNSRCKFSGKILKDNGDGTYVVKFTDGETVNNVIGKHIEKMFGNKVKYDDIDALDSEQIYSTNQSKKRKRSSPEHYEAVPASNKGNNKSINNNKRSKESNSLDCNVGDIVINTKQIKSILLKNPVNNRKFISNCNLMFYAGNKVSINKEGNFEFKYIFYPIILNKHELISSYQYKFDIDYSKQIDNIDISNVCNFAAKCAKHQKLCSYTFISNKSVIIEM